MIPCLSALASLVSPRVGGEIMARLFGAQRMVLQAILDAQGEAQVFIEDTRICQATRISLRDMRDWFLTLDNDELVDLALTENGLSPR